MEGFVAVWVCHLRLTTNIGATRKLTQIFWSGMDGVNQYLAQLTTEAGADTIKRASKLQDIQKLKDKFLGSVRSFYVHATSYAKKKLPLTDNVLKNVEVSDPTNRDNASFKMITYSPHGACWLSASGSAAGIWGRTRN